MLQMKKLKFVIITGLSGAGKTQAVRCFEDMGYYCIDNLPPTLILKFAQLCSQSKGHIEKVALVIDIRGGEFFESLFDNLELLKEQGFSYEILFLEASDSVLIKRFKETRRVHPLAPMGRIIEGIKEERKKLKNLKEKADQIIDTTNLTPSQLKEEIKARFSYGKKHRKLVITVLSFGFKYGIPMDTDLVFDVRFIPNPYYVDSLRKYSGNDDKIMQYVSKWEVTQTFLKKLEDLLEFLIPHYIKEGKTHLVIGIGCTGGRHRSVAIARKITEMLKNKSHSVIVTHRDIYHEEEGAEH